jgi:hypothetical protein
MATKAGKSGDRLRYETVQQLQSRSVQLQNRTTLSPRWIVAQENQVRLGNAPQLACFKSKKRQKEHSAGPSVDNERQDCNTVRFTTEIDRKCLAFQPHP